MSTTVIVLSVIMAVAVVVVIGVYRWLWILQKMSKKGKEPDIEYLQRLAQEIERGVYDIDKGGVAGMGIFLGVNKEVKGDRWSPLLSKKEYDILCDLVRRRSAS